MSQSKLLQQLAASPVVLVNPRAGACRRADLTRLAAELGLGDRAFRTIGRDGSARALAARAVRDAAPVVVAVGGDGTIHQVIQELAGTTTALGIVPLGTSNDLAADLGMTSDSGVIHRALAAGAITTIDLLWTPAAWIATAGGLGLPGEVALRCNELRVGPHRWWAGRLGTAIYSAVAAHQICRRPLPATRYDMNAGGWSVSQTGTALLVSRVARFGGLRLVQRPLAARTFCAVLVTASRPRGLLEVLARLRLGWSPGREALVFHGLRDLRVRTRGLVRGFGDGESLGVGHRARFSLVPDALRVVVPQAASPVSLREQQEVG